MPDSPIAIPGAPLSAHNTPSTLPEIQHAAEQFEAMFLSEMLAPMFEGLDTEGLGGGGMGEQIFRPMLVERYAEAIAKSGGVGLAENLVRELNRLQATPEQIEGAADGADR